MRIDQAYTRYLVDGEITALDDLLAAANRIALSVARRLGCDDAEDIAQLASIRVWERIRDYDPTRASLSTWIGSIVRRLAIDQYRSTPPRTTVLDEMMTPHQPRMDYLTLDLSSLSQADARAVAVMTLHPDYAAAAATLGVSVPALRKRMQRLAAKTTLETL